MRMLAVPSWLLLYVSYCGRCCHYMTLFNSLPSLRHDLLKDRLKEVNSIAKVPELVCGRAGIQIQESSTVWDVSRRFPCLTHPRFNLYLRWPSFPNQVISKWCTSSWGSSRTRHFSGGCPRERVQCGTWTCCGPGLAAYIRVTCRLRGWPVGQGWLVKDFNPCLGTGSVGALSLPFSHT